MALFQIDTQKTAAGYSWTNVYVVDAADLSVAHAAAFEVFAIQEQAIHATFMTISRIRTSTLIEGDDSFRSTPLALAGTLTTNGNALPLFNVVRADLGAATGRPSRKYYRCGLGSGDVAAFYRWAGGQITTIRAVIESIRDEAAAAGATWVDPQGELLGEVGMFAEIGMHQLRRGSKRREEEPIALGAPGPSRKRESLAAKVKRLEKELFALRKSSTPLGGPLE